MPVGRGETRIATRVPELQYSNKYNQARPLHGDADFMPHVGYYIEIGKDSRLDEALEQLGIPQMEMKHPRQGASAHIARHWNLGRRIRFFPVTQGPPAQTVSACNDGETAIETARRGIGLRWGSEGRSKYAVRGFMALARNPEATEWHKPIPILVQFVARSRMTDVLNTALVWHARLCEKADSIINRREHPDPVDLYEIALEMGTGPEEEWGRQETSSVVPMACLHLENLLKRFAAWAAEQGQGQFPALPRRATLAEHLTWLNRVHGDEIQRQLRVELSAEMPDLMGIVLQVLPIEVVKKYVSVPGMWRTNAIYTAANQAWPSIPNWAVEYRTEGEGSRAAPAPARYDEPEPGAATRSSRGEGGAPAPRSQAQPARPAGTSAQRPAAAAPNGAGAARRVAPVAARQRRGEENLL